MPKPNIITGFFKEPLVLLLLLGVGIYGGYRYLEAREEGVDETRIQVTAAQIDGMATQWAKRWNRPPTQEELDGLIKKYVRDEILYRQALAMGLHKNDPVTRLRTVQKLEYLTNDLATAQEPTDAELKQYLTDNVAKFRLPDQITFLQVFFNPDTRKDATVAEAEAALEELKAAGEPDPETLKAGDRSMMQSYFRSVSEAEIGRQMGSGFAESAIKLEPGQWHGPVLSGYGVHLVYVYALEEGVVPPLDSIKDKVLAAWNDEKREEFSAQFLEGLRKQYEIEIEEVSPELILNRPEPSAKPSAEPSADSGKAASQES